MGRHLTGKEQVDIVNAFQSELITVIALAEQYGLTRAGIYKVLKRAGVDTTNHKIDVSCSTCGKVIDRHKSRIRKQLNHFCSPECYHAFLEAGNGSPLILNRHGSEQARAKVVKYFDLKKGNIVHHENRNQCDNRLYNLRVFATQGDHLRHHRGFDVTPIWDGRTAQPLDPLA
jgi:hypothetical protein